MKIPHRINPALVASKDESRPIINLVQISGDLAAATDGRRLVVVHAPREEDDCEKDLYIHADSFRDLMKKSLPASDGFKLTENGITAHEIGRTTTYEATDLEELGHAPYPDLSKVIPDPAAHTIRIGLNPAYLTSIAQAMSADRHPLTGITLHLNPDLTEDTSDGKYLSGPILITPHIAPEDAFGVLMPMKPVTLDIGLAKNKALHLMRLRGVPGEWKSIRTAPKDATWIEIISPDLKTTLRAHYAQDLSGENQPAFRGWFHRPEGSNDFLGVPFSPLAWRPIAESSPLETES